MFKLIRKLRTDEKGATAIEYGLIVAVIAVVSIVAMAAVGTSLTSMFTTVSENLDPDKP